MPISPYTRVGRGELLSRGALNLAARRQQPATMQLAARPIALKEPDEHDEQIAKVAQMLGVDNEADWNRIATMQRELERRGIASIGDLHDVLDGRGAHNYRAPAPPRASLSALYSDIEVLDTVSTDTVIVDIPTVAIGGGTQTVTLAQMPMKWGFSDFTVDGDVLGTGSLKLIEVAIILGTRTITKFRLSQLSRTSDSSMVFDALQKIYDFEIGPNSTVQVKVTNNNAVAGDTFNNGFFQYVYAPVIDNEAARVLRGGTFY